MASTNHSARKNAALAAVVILTTISAPLFFVSAGFGGNWKRPVHYDVEPILQCIDSTVYPGGTANCYVSVSPTAASPSAWRGGHRGTAKNGGSYIHIYSDPAGAVSYDGPISGSSDVVPAAVSPNAPSGPVRIYLQTPDGAVTSDTTTVSS